MTPKAANAMVYLVAFAVSMSLLAHLSGYDRLDGPVLVVLAGLTLGLGAILRRLVPPAGSVWTNAVTVRFAVLCLLMAGGLYFALPIRSDVFPRAADVYVSAIGSAAGTRGASEVWAKVEQADGAVIKPKTVPVGWKINDDGGVVAAGTTSEAVQWRIPIDSGARLILIRHPWSGQARIDWLGHRRDVQLYSAQTDQSQVIELRGRPLARFRNKISAWAVAVADVITLAVIFLLVGNMVGTVMRRDR
jgi:hypothetical protein